MIDIVVNDDRFDFAISWAIKIFLVRIRRIVKIRWAYREISSWEEPPTSKDVATATEVRAVVEVATKKIEAVWERGKVMGAATPSIGGKGANLIFKKE